MALGSDLRGFSIPTDLSGSKVNRKVNGQSSFARMADIFISYANEDRETAARLANVLESAGWSVWWDRRIPAGRTWRSVLEEALKDMRCMITLWSKDSVESPWVAEEAEEARRLGKRLVPILIQRVDPPIGFRAIQAADLVHWDGTIDDPSLQQLITDLKSLLGSPSAKPSDKNEITDGRLDRTQPTIFQRLKNHWPQAAMAGVVVVALLAGWQKWKGPQDEPVARSPLETDSVNTIPPSRITSLTLNGERREIRPSETIQLKVIAQYSDGKKADMSEGIEWSSNNSEVALVNERGEVKGVGAGSATIRAKTGGVESLGWGVSVKAAPETTVEVAAAPKLLGVNVISNRNELFPKEKIWLRAQGRYSDNVEKYLSSGIDWETSDRTVASISPNGQLEALRPGKVKVVARSGDLQSAPVAFIVKEPQARPQLPTKAARTVEPQPMAPPALSEQAKARIAAHVGRAKTFREQGNYAGALAELEKAKAIDMQNEEVRREIEQTQRACNAEKVLGNKPNC